MGIGAEGAMSEINRSQRRDPPMASGSAPPPSANHGRGSRHMPIDLTADSPPRKRSAKRGLPSDFDASSSMTPAKLHRTGLLPKMAMTEMPMFQKTTPKRTTPKKAASKKASPEKDEFQYEERRLRRWRNTAPSAYRTIRGRAMTQRIFVLDRQRDYSYPDHPIETVKMAGTTGNVYTIVIDKIPSCDCPHAMQGNQCKHVVYVLTRVLRAPPELEYQLAFVSSELQRIFEQAPPLPSKQADDSKKDGNRKPLEGECPICCEDFDPKNTQEDIVYCKGSCGNNIHKQCFDRWAKTKAGATVTCPFCRSPWIAETTNMQTLTKGRRANWEGYVNVGAELGLPQWRDSSSYNEYFLNSIRGDHEHWF